MIRVELDELPGAFVKCATKERRRAGGGAAFIGAVQAPFSGSARARRVVPTLRDGVW